MPTLRIHEIYQSVQGESTMAGLPCTFIRLAGCPLRCKDCDTPQALEPNSGKEMSIDAIIERILPLNHRMILVTGGEPLAQKHCMTLLRALKPHCTCLQLETSGCYDIADVPAHVQIILDIKTPMSGEVERNRWDNIDKLKPQDEIKFVIHNAHDYVWSVGMIRQYQLDEKFQVLLSPAWNAVHPQALVEWMLEDHIFVRLQLQQHKYIWHAEATGV